MDGPIQGSVRPCTGHSTGLHFQESKCQLFARTGPLRLRVSGTGAGAMRPGPAWEYRFSGVADARLSALQKCLQPFPRSRISSQIKNGPPSSAVRIPTGRRAGAIRIRAVISQIARNAAPKMMLPQNKTR